MPFLLSRDIIPKKALEIYPRFLVVFFGSLFDNPKRRHFASISRVEFRGRLFCYAGGGRDVFSEGGDFKFSR